MTYIVRFVLRKKKGRNFSGHCGRAQYQENADTPLKSKKIKKTTAVILNYITHSVNVGQRRGSSNGRVLQRFFK